MYETLQLHVGAGLMDGAYLVDREFAGQHHLTEPHVVELLHMLRCLIVHLGACMEGYGWEVERKQAQVLHYERIDIYFVELADELLHIVQFVIAQQGVYRHINLGTELVCISHQPADILDTVASRSTRSESWSTYIHGIGSMLDGLDADICRARWRQEFEFSHVYPLCCMGFLDKRSS